MLTLGVNETQTLTSYEGHQFLFQSFHQEDLSSSFFYTKLGDDELLILYHDDAVGLSFIQQNVVQPTYRPVTRLPPLTLNEKFENYVFPDPETSFKVGFLLTS